VKFAHGEWGDFLADARGSRLKGNKCDRKRGASVGTIGTVPYSSRLIVSRRCKNEVTVFIKPMTPSYQYPCCNLVGRNINSCDHRT